MVIAIDIALIWIWRGLSRVFCCPSNTKPQHYGYSSFLTSWMWCTARPPIVGCCTREENYCTAARVKTTRGSAAWVVTPYIPYSPLIVGRAPSYLPTLCSPALCKTLKKFYCSLSAPLLGRLDTPLLLLRPSTAPPPAWGRNPSRLWTGQYLLCSTGVHTPKIICPSIPRCSLMGAP